MKATNFLKALLVPAACLFLYSCDMAYDMGGVFMPDASYDEAMPDNNRPYHEEEKQNYPM